MSTLHNLVQIDEGNGDRSELVAESKVQEYADVFRQASDLQALLDRTSHDNPLATTEDLFEQMGTLAEAHFDEHGYLPSRDEMEASGVSFESHYESDLDPPERMAAFIRDGVEVSTGHGEERAFSERWYDTPTSDIAAIKDIADKLEFVILPLEYFQDEWRPDDDVVDEQLDAFQKMASMSPHGDKVFVLCPIKAYDVRARAVADDPKQARYVPSSLEGVEQSVNLQIPLFREIFKRLDSLEETQDKLVERSEEARENLNMLVDELENVHDRIEEVRREAIKKAEEAMEVAEEVKEIAEEAREEAREAQRRAEEAERSQERLNRQLNQMQSRISQRSRRSSSMSFRMSDPMAFAAPDLEDGTRAKIGPCWGPEISELMLLASGFDLDAREDHRDTIESALETYRDMEIDHTTWEVTEDDDGMPSILG